MTIVVVNDVGCLIDEKEYETDNATEAMMKYMANNPSLEIGDVIQIRE